MAHHNVGHEVIVERYFAKNKERENIVKHITGRAELPVLAQSIQHIEKQRDTKFLENVLCRIRRCHFEELPSCTPKNRVMWRVNDFFSLHQREHDPYKAVNYIKFQKLVVSNMRRGYLNDMTLPEYSGGARKKKAAHNRFVPSAKRYLGAIGSTPSLAKRISSRMMRSAVEKDPDTERYRELVKSVKKCVEKLVNCTLRNNTLQKREYSVVSYGSYTSHLINDNVEYNDIDIYHTRSYMFLNMILFVFFVLTDFDECVDFYNIPLVPFLTPLRFRGQNILDCIYIDNYILGQMIKTVVVDGVRIVHPLHQMFNNIRMTSEIDRTAKLAESAERYALAWSSLLGWCEAKKEIDLGRIEEQMDMDMFLSKFDVSLDKAVVSVDLDSFLDKRSPGSPRYFVFLLLDEPVKFVNYMYEVGRSWDIRISNYAFAFFNELSFRVDGSRARGEKGGAADTHTAGACTYFLRQVPPVDKVDRANVSIRADTVVCTSYSLTVYFNHKKNQLKKRSAVALLASVAQYCMLHDHLEEARGLAYPIFSAMHNVEECMEDSYYVERYKIKSREHKRMSLFDGEFKSIGRGRADEDVEIPQSPYLPSVRYFAKMVDGLKFTWLQ